MSPPPRLLRLLLLAGSWVGAGLPGLAAPAEPLATAAEILSLTAEEAGSRKRVAVTGIVTAAEPDWSGQFFVQDSTGGVFVENLNRPAPAPGDRVTVTGVSHPGAFAPIISEPHWQKIGDAPLPPARIVSIENLKTGVEDGQRVEISGVVRAVRIEFSRLDLDIAIGGYRLQVRAPLPSSGAPDLLIASRVRVRGTAATHYNAALRHLTSVAVYVPRTDDFQVLEPEAIDPFLQPVIPLNALAQYRPKGRHLQRVHVRGVLTLRRPGRDQFLQDASGGIRLEGAGLDGEPGDEFDAAGFLEFESFLPLLRDATLRKSARTNPPITPRIVPAAELRDGFHQAELITLRGRILDRSTRPVTSPAGGVEHSAMTWFVQGDPLNFTVEYEAPGPDAQLASVPAGSLVEVDGVCLSSVETDGKLKSLQILLRSPGDVRVLRRPSWLTPERLLISISLLSLVLAAVVGWLVTVAKKNAALRYTVGELEKAQRELQEAHDTLEQKVAERSAQLHVEMTARRAAELQSKAVLAERTRFARELHDSLEQTLTGIALQLDTAAKLFQPKPDASQHHLHLARNWLRQSQVELRRSIWDLRSRELEQFDLANALRQSTEHLVDGSELALEFRTEGNRRALPEVVEENVLRIGQEAVTNVVKHARASRLAVTLSFKPEALRLVIEDNGIGFDSPASPSPGDNHFGLLGMSERARRVAGQLQVDSRHGRGTVIDVEIPLEPPETNSNP